ncbi:methionine ABC transporter ATP-binding protein [Clostridium coskatii]|uniref:Methionine import ATP-binding protein MetN n=1 Tax=Clostridium coskatii TaxID=1705578 RepID=A0A166UNT9_9CLOT|nr:methionine ABC transporter ATP-binding protein [Clostridium coskatii]OAA95099.1 Methionine import ATP-binding protein MetN [Clostridium coskatii]OBR97553.1 methionine import ATP-binding protein MetN [Clostridium coskatii]
MIEIFNVHKSFGGKKVLKNINLTINDGEIYGLIGRSGVGKSTLLRCINGIETYDSGSLKVDGLEVKDFSNKELRSFRKNVGMIFQHFSLMERKTVYDNVALPMVCWGYKKEIIDKRVRELLKIVDIEDKMYLRPRVLSGGQKQRVAIARALSLNPRNLLCDEATSSLDPKTTSSILSLLRKINETLGITIVLVTHEMSVVRQICQKVSILEDGEISASGDVSDIFLNKPKALKNLLGEEFEEMLPSEGVNIRIRYLEDSVNKMVLSEIARILNINFSIASAKLDKYRDKVLGSIVINTNRENLKVVTEFLEGKSIAWEVVSNGH